MTPEEALKFVDQALAQMQGPRQFHINVQEAMEALTGAIVTEPAAVEE